MNRDDGSTLLLEWMPAQNHLWRYCRCMVSKHPFAVDVDIVDVVVVTCWTVVQIVPDINVGPI